MGKETLTDTFCRLQKKLHLVAGRLLNDETEAEDAVQDAFCRLWSAEPPGSTDEARYRMFAVLRNVCLNKLRRKRAQSGTGLPEVRQALGGVAAGGRGAGQPPRFRRLARGAAEASYALTEKSVQSVD